jgi:hypothetical protein
MCETDTPISPIQGPAKKESSGLNWRFSWNTEITVAILIIYILF